MNAPVNKKNGLAVYLEGWLLKKKSNDSSLLFKSHNQRWFRLQDVQGADHKELALCYYQNQRESEAKGWIYMKDITSIIEEKKAFIIISHARTMVLEATTAAEHNSWIAELFRACPQLRRAESRESSVTTNSTGAKDYPSSGGRASAKADGSNSGDGQYPTLNQDALRSLDSKSSSASNNNIDRSVSLFSRHAQGEKNSFYNAQGKPGIPISHTESGEENYREHELLVPLQPELMRSTDSIAGLLEREQRQLQSSSRDGHPPRPRSDSRGHRGDQYNSGSRDVDDNGSEGSNGRRSASNHTQDDHRKHGYRHGGDVTHRLHRHIAKDSPPPEARRDRDTDSRNRDDLDDRDDYYPANSTSSRHSSRQGSATRRHEDDIYDQPHQQEERTSSHNRRFSNNNNNNHSNDDDDEDVQDVSLRVRRTSRQTSDDSSPVQHERRDSRSAFMETNSSNRESNRGDNAPGSGIASNSAGPGASSSSSSSLSSSSSSVVTGTGGAKKFSKKAPPPPTVAPPPRRARDITDDDDDETSGGANAHNPVRHSIDELLFQKNAEQAARTEEKGNGEEDEEIDFKAEYARYAESKGMSPENVSGKPPRHQGAASSSSIPGRSSAAPPSSSSSSAGAPSVYTMPNHRNPQARAGTPPRPQGNAGPQADRNFATENWDEDEDDRQSAAAKWLGNATVDEGSADAKPISGARLSGKEAKSAGLNPTAMMADANWLEANFDD